jgi:hypothetical protein
MDKVRLKKHQQVNKNLKLQKAQHKDNSHQLKVKVLNKKNLNMR